MDDEETELEEGATLDGDETELEEGATLDEDETDVGSRAILDAEGRTTAGQLKGFELMLSATLVRLKYASILRIFNTLSFSGGP